MGMLGRTERGTSRPAAGTNGTGSCERFSKRRVCNCGRCGPGRPALRDQKKSGALTSAAYKSPTNLGSYRSFPPLPCEPESSREPELPCELEPPEDSERE